ncbi:hypothetical protein I553_0437 [Mycobacterium xenopi 4042]|uniref:Uncharacterized protein n=1 Tax=Mycobacterium xenopi 4042 TaxID=1299334 RepID=X7YII0_MYCXE|nr:hypothetical protein I553_0437 [Mycobacterium xenopi 4042]
MTGCGPIRVVGPRHAGQRALQRAQGSFFAAGLTYYTILSLFRC